MSGGLQIAGDDEARCAFCGARAAGPCASCHRPVCGDCCTLTEGGARVWAICLDCDRRGGRSLTPGWRAVILWLLLPLVALAIVVAILAKLAG